MEDETETHQRIKMKIFLVCTEENIDETHKIRE